MKILYIYTFIFLASQSFNYLVWAGENHSISVVDVANRTSNNEILLIDIRRPSEWQQTGVALNARLISMHGLGFTRGIAKITHGVKSKPIALICAIGGRSLKMQKKLADLGYTQVFNVIQGMSGNGEGFGWIDEELPMRRYSQPVFNDKNFSADR